MLIPLRNYSNYSICFPFGFGIEKAFSNNSGIKLEGGFRYTRTDYIDDVSNSFYDRKLIEENYGNLAATMRGTYSGNTFVRLGYANDDNFPDGAIFDPLVTGYQPYTIDITYTEPKSERGNHDNNDCLLTTHNYYELLTHCLLLLLLLLTTNYY